MKISKNENNEPDGLKQKIQELEDKTTDLNNKYLRSLADYQNLEKQTQSWKEEFVKFANQDLIAQLLEILDNLEKAQEHIQDTGLQLIIDKLKIILKNKGLEEIKAEGEEFDPNLFEALEVIPGEEDNKVLGIIQKGYRLNGRVIRPAKVKVSKKV